jgi:hypothetical protein
MHQLLFSDYLAMLDQQRDYFLENWVIPFHTTNEMYYYTETNPGLKSDVLSFITCNFSWLTVYMHFNHFDVSDTPANFISFENRSN